MQAEKDLYCLECGDPATWVRKTQFSGNHPFCTEHAKQQDDFGKSNPSYFSWIKLSSDKIAPKHRQFVEGYEGRLEKLSKSVHQMRYKEVAEFYRLTADELIRQSRNDKANNRDELAALLIEAYRAAAEQSLRFQRIWELCEPHMAQ